MPFWLFCVLSLVTCRSVADANSAFASRAAITAAKNCTVRDTCALRHFLSGNHVQYKNCECDSYCSMFTDCCHDVDHKHHWNKEQQAEIQGDIECRKVYSINRFRRVFIVTSCPVGYAHDDVTAGCEMTFDEFMAGTNSTNYSRFANDILFTQVPVTSSISTVLYKNVYCAICHQESRIVLWGIRIYRNVRFETTELTNGTLLTDTFRTAMQRRFVLHEVPPNVEPRFCEETVSECPQSWQNKTTVLQCQSFLSYSFHTPTKQVFRNQFCAECNGIDFNLTCQSFHPFTYTSRSASRRFPSYSILLDFYTGKGSIQSKVGIRTVKEDVTLGSCQSDQIFDPFQGACRQLHCDLGSRVKYGQCVPEFNGSNSDWMDCAPGRRDGVGINATAAALCLLGNQSDRQNRTGYDQTFAFGAAQGYVTFIGNVLSILCLIVHLLVYSCLPTLRNLPGKCLICLSASLLLAQSLFTFASARTSVYTLCLAIAILMHFGYLAYFCWMGVLAFDVWRAFTVCTQVNPASQRQDSRRQFVRYSTFAWLLPIAIVIISGLLDQVESPVKPMYATGPFCWIGSRVGLLLLFATPAGTILAMNMTFFALTTRYIQRTRSSSSEIAHRTKNDANRFCLYLKLCTVMGLTWLLGILSAFVDKEPLWYIYLILNTLQGVYICVSFVFTRKVFKLLLEKCRSSHPKHLSSDRKATTSTKQTLLQDGSTDEKRKSREIVADVSHVVISTHNHTS